MSHPEDQSMALRRTGASDEMDLDLVVAGNNQVVSRPASGASNRPASSASNKGPSPNTEKIRVLTANLNAFGERMDQLQGALNEGLHANQNQFDRIMRALSQQQAQPQPPLQLTSNYTPPQVSTEEDEEMREAPVPPASTDPSDQTPSQSDQSHDPNQLVPPNAPVNQTFINNHINPDLIAPRPLMPPTSLLTNKAFSLYSGERKDAACERWCIEARQYMARVKLFTTAELSDEQQVAIATQYLRGAASKWFAHRWQNGYGCPNLDTFLNDLCARFSDLNTAERRRAKYESNVQGNRTFNEYWIEFDSNLTFLDPRPTEYEMLRQLKKGTKTSLRQEMDLRHSDILSYMGYASQADKIDVAWALRRDERNKEKDKDTADGSGRGGNKKTKKSNLTAMGASNEAPTPETRTCYNCKAVSHIGKDCSEPDKRKSKKDNKGKGQGSK